MPMTTMPTTTDDIHISQEHNVNEISFQKIQDMTNNFTTEVLGKGSFATVFKGNMYRQEVAVKVDKEIADREAQSFIRKQFVAEVHALYRYKHPNLCMLLAHSIDSPNRCLLYELCHNGSIFDRLHNHTLPALTWPQRLNLALGATQALVYLHPQNPPSVHRDIKSPNILITSDYQAKVSDFGTVREMGGATDPATSMQTRAIIGTHHYMPPGYVQHGTITVK